MSTETLRSLFYRIPTAEIGNTGIRILFCFFIFLFFYFVSFLLFALGVRETARYSRICRTARDNFTVCSHRDRLYAFGNGR